MPALQANSFWNFQLFTLNPLSPKGDQYQNSPCDSNAFYNRLVVRIKAMIAQDTMSWCFNNFSLLLLKQTYSDIKWEFEFWY